MEFRFSDYRAPFKVLEFRRLMQEAPYWPPGELDAQVRRWRLGVVAYAAANVPFYANSYAAAGVQTGGVDTDETWWRVPTIRKETIVDNSDRMVASGIDREVRWARTSGSSGMPMKVAQDASIRSAAFALFWRAWSSGGYWRMGQKQAVMKGATHAGVMRLNWKLRALLVASARVSSETTREIRDGIHAYEPRFMRGYPSSMSLFCRFLREQDLRLHVPMVISGSETLHDHQRAEIESVLGTRVFNHWTHWERAGSILECVHGRLHAQQDYGLHEILDVHDRPVPPGVEGELTVTGWYNRAMPLIRYRTGDFATWSAEKCACGQAFPVVERILGRETDLLYRKDGSAIPASGVTSLLKAWTSVRFAQLIQREVGAIEVRLVRGPGFDDAMSRRIRADIESLSDGQLAVDIVFCDLDGLERSPVGKLRQCFNRIPPGQRPSQPQHTGR